MSTRGTSTAGIARATGIPWETWTARLEELGARSMSHAEIARRVAEQLDGVVENHEWWAQSVTVAWEQHTGVRRPGQTGDGSFGTSASRTVAGTPDEVLTRWTELLAGRTEVDGVPFRQPPSTARTEKWRYWRARLADGTRVAATLGEAGRGRTTVAVAHTGLPSAEDVARWRGVWKELLAALP
ncbi:hypothetical protein QYM41_14080 [Kocuria sp. CPCC 205268]|uniref:hypothetical protein n=1 Tax=Kocuria oxytropis TaxID=3058913 RepID=UPI0034D6B160